MEECTDNCSTSRYVTNDDLNGPAFAVVIGIEMILTLLTNLTIFIFTLYQWKSLKQPSIIFLTGLVLANLMMAIFFMPFTVITAAVGEWIFGKTVREKQAVCEFVGFMFGLSVGYSTHTLALISFDRFLFIVKPLLYIKYMKTWRAVVIISTLWVILTVLNTTPWYGLGQFKVLPYICSCFPEFTRPYLIYFSFVSIIPYATITVTSTWTFFILNDSSQDVTMKTWLLLCQLKDKSSDRHLKLVKFRNVPPVVLASTLVFYLLHTFTNAVVQSYFRQDLILMFIIAMKRMRCQRHSNNLQVNQESNISMDQCTN